MTPHPHPAGGVKMTPSAVGGTGSSIASATPCAPPTSAEEPYLVGAVFVVLASLLTGLGLFIGRMCIGAGLLLWSSLFSAAALPELAVLSGAGVPILCHLDVICISSAHLTTAFLVGAYALLAAAGRRVELLRPVEAFLYNCAQIFANKILLDKECALDRVDPKFVETQLGPFLAEMQQHRVHAHRFLFQMGREEKKQLVIGIFLRVLKTAGGWVGIGEPSIEEELAGSKRVLENYNFGCMHVRLAILEKRSELRKKGAPTGFSGVRGGPGGGSALLGADIRTHRPPSLQEYFCRRAAAGYASPSICFTFSPCTTTTKELPHEDIYLPWADTTESPLVVAPRPPPAETAGVLLEARPPSSSTASTSTGTFTSSTSSTTSSSTSSEKEAGTARRPGPGAGAATTGGTASTTVAPWPFSPAEVLAAVPAVLQRGKKGGPELATTSSTPNQHIKLDGGAPTTKSGSATTLDLEKEDRRTTTTAPSSTAGSIVQPQQAATVSTAAAGGMIARAAPAAGPSSGSGSGQAGFENDSPPAPPPAAPAAPRLLLATLPNYKTVPKIRAPPSPPEEKGAAAAAAAAASSAAGNTSKAATDGSGGGAGEKQASQGIKQGNARSSVSAPDDASGVKLPAPPATASSFARPSPDVHMRPEDAHTTKANGAQGQKGSKTRAEKYGIPPPQPTVAEVAPGPVSSQPGGVEQVGDPTSTTEKPSTTPPPDKTGKNEGSGSNMVAGRTGTGRGTSISLLSQKLVAPQASSCTSSAGPGGPAPHPPALSAKQMQTIQHDRSCHGKLRQRYLRRLNVREVTARNFEPELQLMAYTAARARYCLVSTLTTGFSPPSSGGLPATPSSSSSNMNGQLPAHVQNYARIRDNVNGYNGKMLQLSLCFTNELFEITDKQTMNLPRNKDGDWLPLVWQLLFAFDWSKDLRALSDANDLFHAPSTKHTHELNASVESTLFPRGCDSRHWNDRGGINWWRLQSEGLSLKQVGPPLAKRVLQQPDLTMISCDGQRDFPFLLHAATQQELPRSLAEFYSQLESTYPRRVDLKHLMLSGRTLAKVKKLGSGGSNYKTVEQGQGGGEVLVASSCETTRTPGKAVDEAKKDDKEKRIVPDDAAACGAGSGAGGEDRLRNAVTLRRNATIPEILLAVLDEKTRTVLKKINSVEALGTNMGVWELCQCFGVDNRFDSQYERGLMYQTGSETLLLRMLLKRLTANVDLRRVEMLADHCDVDHGGAPEDTKTTCKTKTASKSRTNSKTLTLDLASLLRPWDGNGVFAELGENTDLEGKIFGLCEDYQAAEFVELAPHRREPIFAHELAQRYAAFAKKDVRFDANFTRVYDPLPRQKDQNLIQALTTLTSTPSRLDGNTTITTKQQAAAAAAAMKESLPKRASRAVNAVLSKFNTNPEARKRKSAGVNAEIEQHVKALYHMWNSGQCPQKFRLPVNSMMAGIPDLELGKDAAAVYVPATTSGLASSSPSLPTSGQLGVGASAQGQLLLHQMEAVVLPPGRAAASHNTSAPSATYRNYLATGAHQHPQQDPSFNPRTAQGGASSGGMMYHQHQGQVSQHQQGGQLYQYPYVGAPAPAPQRHAGHGHSNFTRGVHLQPAASVRGGVLTNGAAVAAPPLRGDHGNNQQQMLKNASMYPAPHQDQLQQSAGLVNGASQTGGRTTNFHVSAMNAHSGKGNGGAGVGAGIHMSKNMKGATATAGNAAAMSASCSTKSNFTSTRPGANPHEVHLQAHPPQSPTVVGTSLGTTVDGPSANRGNSAPTETATGRSPILDARNSATPVPIQQVPVMQYASGAAMDPQPVPSAAPHAAMTMVHQHQQQPQGSPGGQLWHPHQWMDGSSGAMIYGAQHQQIPGVQMQQQQQQLYPGSGLPIDHYNAAGAKMSPGKGAGIYRQQANGGVCTNVGPATAVQAKVGANAAANVKKKKGALPPGPGPAMGTSKAKGGAATANGRPAMSSNR